MLEMSSATRLLSCSATFMKAARTQHQSHNVRLSVHHLALNLHVIDRQQEDAAVGFPF